MVDERESPKTETEGQQLEQDKQKLYIDIIYREADIARTVRRIRNANIRAIHKPGDSYDNNYPEGVNLVRRIYKHQGIDSTPRLLGLID